MGMECYRASGFAAAIIAWIFIVVSQIALKRRICRFVQIISVSSILLIFIK